MGYSRVVIFMVLCYGWIFYEIAEKIKIYTELRQEAQDQECSYSTSPRNRYLNEIHIYTDRLK